MLSGDASWGPTASHMAVKVGGWGQGRLKLSSPLYHLDFDIYHSSLGNEILLCVRLLEYTKCRHHADTWRVHPPPTLPAPLHPRSAHRALAHHLRLDWSGVKS